MFLSYEENMISDEEFLLLYDEYSSKNLEFEPLREFQPENLRFEVRNRSSWLSCCKHTSGWRPRYQERLVLKFPIILRWTALYALLLWQKKWSWEHFISNKIFNCLFCVFKTCHGIGKRCNNKTFKALTSQTDHT